MLAFATMMRHQIVMPAHLMDDGCHTATNQGRVLFDDFAMVAERTGVYTARDYVEIMQHLIEYWGVADLRGLTPEVGGTLGVVH